jgi:hypothetical protein
MAAGAFDAWARTAGDDKSFRGDSRNPQSRKGAKMPAHLWKVLLTTAFTLASTSAFASGACDSVHMSIQQNVSELTECIGDLQFHNTTNDMIIDNLSNELEIMQGFICTLATEIAQRDTSDASAASFASTMCLHPKPKQRPKQKPQKVPPQQK